MYQIQPVSFALDQSGNAEAINRFNDWKELHYDEIVETKISNSSRSNGAMPRLCDVSREHARIGALASAQQVGDGRSQRYTTRIAVLSARKHRPAAA